MPIKATFRVLAFLLATLAAYAAGIAGKWQFVLQTEGGERQQTVEFQLDGSSVSGKWAGAEVKGTFADDKLNLAFPFSSSEGGLSGTLKITGKLTEGKLTGNWDFEGHGGTFEATPSKEPPMPVRNR